MTSTDPALSLPRGEFAIHRGTTYKSAGPIRGARRLLLDDVAAYEAFPAADVVQRVPHREGQPWMLDVPDHALDRVFQRSVVATWFGEPVTVTKAPDVATGTVEIAYERSPQFAAATHMLGDQYSGWRTLVDATELEDVRAVDRPVQLRETP
ncbi:hypothetical protein [Cellulomonas sp. P5_C6]